MKEAPTTFPVIQEVEIHYRRPIEVTFDKITQEGEAIMVFRDYIDERKLDHKEFFWVMFLSNANHILGISEIGKGTHRDVSIHVKEVFQLALRCNASGVIAAHNHPSGSLEPSKPDLAITNRLKDAGKLLDITLLDHFIITSESYSSIFRKMESLNL